MGEAKQAETSKAHPAEILYREWAELIQAQRIQVNFRHAFIAGWEAVLNQHSDDPVSFHVGDVVRLRSESATMTIAALRDTPANDGKMAQCYWTDNQSNIHNEWLPITILRYCSGAAA